MIEVKSRAKIILIIKLNGLYMTMINLNHAKQIPWSPTD